MIVTPEIGMMSAAGGGKKDLPPEQKKEISQQIRRDLIFLAQHVDDPSFIFTAAGSEKINDITTTIVNVSGMDIHMRWYVDPASGHVVRETYDAMGNSGPFKGETDLSDWTTTDGITLPGTHTNKQDGKDSSLVKTASIQFNPPIDPKLFNKPAADAKPQ